MQVRFHSIKPAFLDVTAHPSDVWDKEVNVDRGAYLQIVAPSGRGKTSLIHFLYGLRDEYSGNIEVDGKKMRKAGLNKLADIRAAQLSIIFQDLRLFKDHTVLRNIEVKRALHPYHPAEKIAEMAERLGIKGKLQQKAGTCSYGEQQRVAIIRGLMQPFDFLIMDEPFAHLDANNAKKAMDLILEEAAARGAGIIMADLDPVPFFPAHQIFHL